MRLFQGDKQGRETCKLLNVRCGCSISFGWKAAVGLAMGGMEVPDSLQGNRDPRREDCALKDPGCEHPTAAATQSLLGELLPLQILQ